MLFMISNNIHIYVFFLLLVYVVSFITLASNLVQSYDDKQKKARMKLCKRAFCFKSRTTFKLIIFHLQI